MTRTDTAPEPRTQRLTAINVFHKRMLDLARQRDVPNHHLCGWSSSDSQQARFRALLRAVNYQGGTVLDFGCGTGDLFGFLQKQDYRFSYVGVDMNDEMLSVARRSYSAVFDKISVDQVPDRNFDYIFASGIFQFEDTEDIRYYERVTSSLLARSRLGTAVNFLSDQRPKAEKRAGELYVSPSEVAELGSRMSGRWSLDHSYHPGSGDMTLGLLVVDVRDAWVRPNF